jgi:ribosomal protein L39E
MNTNNLYNIFSEDNEVERTNLSASEVIDYANAVFYYEIQDNDQEGITSFEDAVMLFEENDMQVVQVHKKGGNITNENYEMVQNQNKQIGHHVDELKSALKNNKEVPAWVVAKVNRSATDLSDATHYIDGRIMALGGNIDEYSAKEFFEGLNMSALPSEIQEYIKSEIISDKNLDLVSVDDETLKRVRDLIAKKYPTSLEDEQKPSETPSSANEKIARFEKEIEELQAFIEIEDDEEKIKRFEIEISELRSFIEIESI